MNIHRWFDAHPWFKAHLGDIVSISIAIVIVALILYHLITTLAYCDALNWSVPECSGVNVTRRP